MLGLELLPSLPLFCVVYPCWRSCRFFSVEIRGFIILLMNAFPFFFRVLNLAPPLFQHLLLSSSLSSPPSSPFYLFFFFFSPPLQVRCSMGLRCVSFGGCGGVQRTIEELELAAVDHHTNVTCLLKHEGAALPPNAKCYLQAALLHTTPNGQRSVGGCRSVCARQGCIVHCVPACCADMHCCSSIFMIYPSCKPYILP